MYLFAHATCDRRSAQGAEPGLTRPRTWGRPSGAYRQLPHRRACPCHSAAEISCRGGPPRAPPPGGGGGVPAARGLAAPAHYRTALTLGVVGARPSAAAPGRGTSHVLPCLTEHAGRH